VIRTGEVLLKSREQWLHFSGAVKIVTAAKVDEVQPALREVERSVFSDNLHAAGFLSYEAAPAFDRAFRVLPPDDFPLLWFGLYPKPSAMTLPAPGGAPAGLDWKPTIERGKYNAAIDEVKEQIAKGRTYQVNYTMRLRADFDGDEWDFFLHLAQSQNKYAAYINTGRYVICSASPELFFELDGDVISGRPMKGTVKRGRTTTEDLEQAGWLRADIKNRAENVMIVDMIRNDIGRIAEIGSVHVPELFTIEKYPTLFQMTSTVRGKTRASISDIFGALFPCASITGAPKVSTMNIIADLETTPRRIYTGSIGFISPERKAQFNVAIRTALIDTETGRAEYGVGGGIVWDSTSADEYHEALLKARVLTEHPKEFSLIETLLWTPEDGFFLREKHIQRMSDSAEYFGFVFSRKKLEEYLDEFSDRLRKSVLENSRHKDSEKDFRSFEQRIRILLNRAGELTGDSQEFQARGKKFKVRLAEKPVDSGNPFLFHKTTRRDVYEEAYKSCRGCDDVLLFNEKDELTEFTIGNLVVELDGELVTPPVSCGLLAGTFRAHLLETGQVREQVIKREELGKCTKTFLVNSVRKWVNINTAGRA
jgi:para-aminobenzoate synthetase/4-amino-4-deoxychorismate lyase